MNFSFKTKATVLFLATCTTSAFSAPWFEGEFRGASASAAELQMAVICRPGERCAVTAARAGGQPQPVEIPIKTPPKLLSPEIPNNNWDSTRQVAASKPELYADPSFGPLLTPLGTALRSGARFAECADLDGTGYLVLCSLSTDREAAKGVMLLLSTMNGSCGELPFCAYYFVPLDRVSRP